MKKTILLVAALFLLLALAACGETQNTPDIDDTYAAPGTEEFYLFSFELEPITPSEPQAEVPEGDITELQVSNDYVGFPTWEAKFGRTSALTDVVRARILDERVEHIIPIWEDERTLEYHASRGFDRHIYTIYRIQILDVFYSWTELSPGDVIEMTQQGGQIGNQRLSFMVERAPIAPGDDLLLFLVIHEGYVRRYPDSELAGLEAHEDFTIFPATFHNPWQLAYHFPAADNRMHSLQADDTIQSVAHPDWVIENPVRPTIGDLAALQLQNFGRLSDSFSALLTDEARAEVLAAAAE